MGHICPVSELLKDCSLSLCLLLAEDNSFPAANPKLSSWSWCQKEMMKSFSAFLYNCLTAFSCVVINIKKSNNILNIPVNVCPLFPTGAVVWVPGVWCMDPTHHWQQKHDGSILKRLIEESLITFFLCVLAHTVMFQQQFRCSICRCCGQQEAPQQIPDRLCWSHSHISADSTPMKASPRNKCVPHSSS